jgi:hypothetical protein
VVPKCTCGAQPPDDARFCHKCARPLYDYVAADVVEAPAIPEVVAAPAPPPPGVSFRNGTAVRIGLVSALLIVLVSAILLPPLDLLRMPVAFGGGCFAVWRWVRRTRQHLSMRDGARLGWIAGVFAFVFIAGATTIMLLVMMSPDFAAEVKQQAPNAAMQSAIVAVQKMGPGELIIGLAGAFIFFTALPTIGGAISARLLNREAR